MVIDQEKLNELKIRYNEKLDEFYLTLNPYNYTNQVWDEIKANFDILKEKVNTIDTDDDDKFKQYYEEMFDEFNKYISGLDTLSSDNLTSREIFFKNIREISEKIGAATKSVWEKIKFIFAVPACTFASFVFAFALTLIFNTFIDWMIPIAYTDEYYGIVDAITAAIIYLVIRIEIFKDVYLNQPQVDTKIYLIKHAIIDCLWWLVFYTIRYKEVVCVYDFNYFEWALFLPYLCIGGITHEYFISCIIAYFILNFVPLIYMVIYIHHMEKTYDLRMAIQERLEKEAEEKRKKGIVEDDSYDYHFVYKDSYGVDESDEEVENNKKKKGKKKK